MPSSGTITSTLAAGIFNHGITVADSSAERNRPHGVTPGGMTAFGASMLLRSPACIASGAQVYCFISARQPMWSQWPCVATMRPMSDGETPAWRSLRANGPNLPGWPPSTTIERSPLTR